MGSIRDFKYKKIKNFLSKDQVSLLNHYCKMKHIINIDNFDFNQSNVGDTYFYADPAMEALMLDKKKWEFDAFNNSEISTAGSYDYNIFHY